jgi:hypothetical protein
MAKIGIRLSDELLGKLWKRFSEGNSVQAICREFQVSRTTIAKYRDKLKWVERRAKIRAKAEAKADKQQISLLAENMKIVRFAKGKIVDQVKAVEAQGEVSKTPIGDLDKLIRLEEFLHGRPDSRPQLDYSKLTEEELTIEFRETIVELMKIPECRVELQKLLDSETS